HINTFIMKKSKLQVMIEFSSVLKQIKSSKKSVNKILNGIWKQSRINIFVTAVIFLSVQCSFATTYYSKTSGGNWTTTSTWSTVTYGNPTNTGTYPQAGDVANI